MGKNIINNKNLPDNCINSDEDVELKSSVHDELNVNAKNIEVKPEVEIIANKDVNFQAQANTNIGGSVKSSNGVTINSPNINIAPGAKISGGSINIGGGKGNVVISGTINAAGNININSNNIESSGKLNAQNIDIQASKIELKDGKLSVKDDGTIILGDDKTELTINDKVEIDKSKIIGK